jgi:hypothetical protein
LINAGNQLQQLQRRTATLTAKTIALGSNTISGTTTQFNTLTDNDFATLAGTKHSPTSG